MKRQYNPSRWYRERNEMICNDYERGMTVYELTLKFSSIFQILTWLCI